MTEKVVLQILNEIRSDLAALNDYIGVEDAAEIRAFRPHERHKGKGMKYSDDRIFRKEG
jgi:hypothetical protein